MAVNRPKVITQDGEPVAHFDLDAVEAEATAEPFKFKLGGEVFEMANPQDADWQVTEDLSTDNQLRAFIAELLGDDFERFAQHKLGMGRMNRLLEACAAHYGVGPGESRASNGSSRSTRRR